MRNDMKYWEYSQILFANQSALGVAQLKKYASELGLDRMKFNKALDGQKFVEDVDRDKRDGFRLGIRSTPIAFVNGRPVVDKSRKALKQAIDSALRK